MLSHEQKREIIAAHKRSENDTGTPEVQIALLSSRIEGLKPHFKNFSKDKSSLRGLKAMVAKRKRLLAYLKKNDLHRYRAIVEKLGLRH